MFSDLFWAIYLIDILSGIGGSLIFSTFIGGVALFALLIYYDHNFESPRPESVRKSFWRAGVPVFLLSLAIAFIPSRQTMYVMLGVKTTQNVVESPLGKKLQTIVDAEIDGYIEKLTPKK